ncbi:hypothetical protein [Streptomyces lutosisoli]|uniref:Lipoprotein n=1 Tax=Streptomyces lutosisoli TaxID=2665721 RepID=A0ABW2VM72_9ACTN
MRRITAAVLTLGLLGLAGCSTEKAPGTSPARSASPTPSGKPLPGEPAETPGHAAQPALWDHTLITSTAGGTVFALDTAHPDTEPVRR